jgi:hypothetical protein
VIEPAYLASVRSQLRAELVLVLVQLEQVCPGWWLSLTELAEQLGTDRATLNRSVSKLESLGLLRRTSLGNGGGTWIWWVKRSPDDAPRSEAEPAWVIRHVTTRTYSRIPISNPYGWAARHEIPKQTMRSFLAGNQLVLRNQWQLVATPMDGLDQAESCVSSPGPSLPGPA